MMEIEVKSLQDLVQYINENEEWPLNVSTIIKYNGWQDITKEKRGVCLNTEGTEMVVINDKGNAIVMKKQTYHEDEWFFHFLNVFLTHAYYWVIIALLIKWIIDHE